MPTRIHLNTSIGLHLGNCSEDAPSQHFMIQKIGEETPIKMGPKLTKCLTVVGQSERGGAKKLDDNIEVEISKCGSKDPEQLFILAERA